MRGPRVWLFAERASWVFGIVCLVSWGALRVDAVTGKSREMRRFVAFQTEALHEPAAPDQSLWSPERIAAWRTAAKDPASPPLAILRIPKIHLEVPVLEGTGDVVLNRAVGHIEDTARPGSDGNSGIAGHRDGFFRGLKDILPGDVIELETLRTTEVYRIERTWVVDPEDVSVLDPTPVRSLTLVTCYPFYFVGPAPRRFIVRAARDENQSADARARPRR